ncbi:Na-translocating system protein MpsC family protein [Bacillus sp. T33-2]|uniref:Na-translocating system protein MpsC family protein n=1 Tax=Bacillus sp. T33-2 TaxID=2054168 RepID=UPI000C757618|nr:Na-translocating system protein MpsC family protein [Bacillus sp. T33-2]PLR94852.1 hypothetical protein CVD19_16410 [Bacillus sp. T33-2]
MQNHKKEKELGSFVGRLLREHFGKGPGAVFATIANPYVTIYVKDFLTPIENKLINKGQNTYVEKLRDMLMETLISEIKIFISVNIGMEIKEFYYDWNLESHSGMFVGISTKENVHLPGKTYDNQEEVHTEIILVSEEAEKKPGAVHSYLLNPRTLVIVREKVLISIERELIFLDFQDTLILAKRNLEKRLIHNHKEKFELYLNAQLENAFVMWDFNLDNSVAVFILQPKK